MTEKTNRYPVQDAPPCPECGGAVVALEVVLAGDLGIMGYPRLEPCGHAIKEATYHDTKLGDESHPHGWSWEAYPHNTEAQSPQA